MRPGRSNASKPLGESQGLVYFPNYHGLRLRRDRGIFLRSLKTCNFSRLAQLLHSIEHIAGHARKTRNNPQEINNVHHPKHSEPLRCSHLDQHFCCPVRDSHHPRQPRSYRLITTLTFKNRNPPCSTPTLPTTPSLQSSRSPYQQFSMLRQLSQPARHSSPDYTRPRGATTTRRSYATACTRD